MVSLLPLFLDRRVGLRFPFPPLCGAWLLPSCRHLLDRRLPSLILTCRELAERFLVMRVGGGKGPRFPVSSQFA